MVNPDGKVGLKVRASTRRTPRERDRILRAIAIASRLVACRPPLTPPSPAWSAARADQQTAHRKTRRRRSGRGGRARGADAGAQHERPRGGGARALDASRVVPVPARAAARGAPAPPPFPLGGANLRDAAALAEYRPMFPGLDDALARSLRVGELLLKNEEAELDRAREYASEAQAGAYLMRRTDVPCVEEREACRTCYETNAADTLRCGAEVAAYDACARAARDAFIERGFAPQPLLEAGGEGEEGAGQDGPEGE